MAFQKSIIKLEGRIDDLSFFRSKGRYSARAKRGVSGARLKTDPAFARTRENMSEFTRAGKATKLFRKAFRKELVDVRDSDFFIRANRLMMSIIKSDPISDRGLRTILNGDMASLQRFEFNGQVPLETSFKAPYSSRIDRAAGTLAVDVPAFIVGDSTTKPADSTHYRLIAAAAELDFAAEHYVSSSAQSADLVIGPLQENVQLICQLPAASTKTIVLAFGIQFGLMSNGKFYPLNNSAHNAMAVVLVDKGTS